MQPTVIQIEKISKRYRIGGLHPGYMTFREMLGDAITAPLRRLRGNNDDYQMLWALREVNLEIRQGELVGIIGQNGAGKSTLLKILSRVSLPTKGRVEIFGRVGSLLEVGTGFHPDLTGRENVYLSGAILGMRRAEIQRKFDQIIAFAEMEQFVETAVKFYSSGMYVRLAFSVAAHLEPEIVIMDEVLAVGDAAFQQKCLDKMHDIRREGRTILFVSHNLPAITRLCKRAILLEAGKVVADGEPHAVVNRYLNSNWNAGGRREWPDDGMAPGDSIVRLHSVGVYNEQSEPTTVVDIHRPFRIEVSYDVNEAGHILLPVIELCNEEGTEVFSTHDTNEEWRRRERAPGRYTSAVTVPGNLLAEGSLLAHVSVMSHFPATILHIRETNAVAFQVVDADEGNTARGDYVGPMPGVVRPLLEWTHQSEGT
jgi:lipopolysaccharide transport system ATP-binding protein